jgi:hypothetical protein
LTSRLPAIAAEAAAAGRGPARAKVDSAAISARIRAMQARREALLEKFPRHTDIAALAVDIERLQAQLRRPAQPPPSAARGTQALRRLAEAQAELSLQQRRSEGFMKAAQTVKPAWTTAQAPSMPRRPVRLDGWKIGAGAAAGALVLGLCIPRLARKKRAAVQNGLWRPEATIPLAVVGSDEKLPEDPLHQNAAALYDAWTILVQDLYAPAPEPPQDLVAKIGPLMQETNAFLTEGYDVMARYLALTVDAQDLHAHVARTVVMSLMAAVEAGAEKEHAEAMALAALFHDLAIVPRPPMAFHEVGSEVGRLSAALVRRIPGLSARTVGLIDDLLVGMDEYQKPMWQNMAADKTLEPMANLLRQIDRFEKLMQKQKARLEKRRAIA